MLIDIIAFDRWVLGAARNIQIVFLTGTAEHCGIAARQLHQWSFDNFISPVVLIAYTAAVWLFLVALFLWHSWRCVLLLPHLEARKFPFPAWAFKVEEGPNVRGNRRTSKYEVAVCVGLKKRSKNVTT